MFGYFRERRQPAEVAENARRSERLSSIGDKLADRISTKAAEAVEASDKLQTTIREMLERHDDLRTHRKSDR